MVYNCQTAIVQFFYLRLLKSIALSILGLLYRCSKIGYRFNTMFSANNHNDWRIPNLKDT